MKEDWDIWEENFKDAKAFFESKGNLQTRAKLKSKWYNNFIKNTKGIKFIFMMIQIIYLNIFIQGLKMITEIQDGERDIINASFEGITFRFQGILISPENNLKLKKLKKEKGFHNINEVINYLINKLNNGS